MIEVREKILLDIDNTDWFSVFDNFSDGIIVTNHTGIIIYYNKTMARIDGLNRENVLMNPVLDVYELTEQESIIMQCLNTHKQITDTPIYYRTHTGKLVNTTHSAFPLFSKKEMKGVICFVRDYNMLVTTLTAMPTPEQDTSTANAATTFDSIIGNEPSFTSAIEAAKMAARTPSPVMLYGETGTGKELFARALHNCSPRSQEKFTPINCAAIPENLLEGILFGTSRGAFTGAVTKAGLFERTSGGTVFLDEVNSMPVGLQSKILRTIQEKKVRRIGTLKEISIDVKIISSVNEDPHHDIAEGRLRADLFYRLGVVFVHIVPLRQRLNDLDILVNYFIKKHNYRLHKQVHTVTQEVMELFRLYQWPGNVRELEHVIEGAMNLTGQQTTITMQHLQPHFLRLLIKNQHNNTKSIATQSNAMTPFRTPPAHQHNLDSMDKQTLKKYQKKEEKELVIQTLTELKGNIAQSARSLGISRQLLYYKIKKFNIDRAQFKKYSNTLPMP